MPIKLFIFAANFSWLGSAGDKTEVSLKVMQKSEIENNGMPIVVFSDMVIVDEELRTIRDSFFKSISATLSQINSPYYLVYRNIAAGCSMFINRKAIYFNPNGKSSQSFSAYPAGKGCIPD